MEKTHFALSWWLRHHQNSKTIEGPDRNCCLTCYFLTTGQNKEKEMKVWWISALYQALFTPCLNLLDSLEKKFNHCFFLPSTVKLEREAEEERIRKHKAAAEKAFQEGIAKAKLVMRRTPIGTDRNHNR